VSASTAAFIGPCTALPIFDGGRLNANLKGAREGSNLLIEQYNQAVLNAVRDVAQTGSRLQALDAETAVQKQRIESVKFASGLSNCSA
jgi:outer membrane protein, multidrug efflux system